MDEALDRMGDPNKTIADNASIKYAGLNFAYEYATNIGAAA